MPLAGAQAGQPEVQAGEEQNPAVWGGSETEYCAWPTTVQVTGNGSLCSGTLIHPQVVMYAAHCEAEDKVVRFGDSSATLKTKQVEYCEVYDGWTGSQTNDWAYCVLAEPMTDIPTTPVGYGCEVNEYLYNGQTVAVVGFGNDSGETGSGRKRWAFTTISNLQNGRFDVGGSEQPTICSGDSGGPAFIRHDDGSWHAYGIASTKSAGTCNSAKGTHSNAVYAVQWIEQDSGIDVTPCHDYDGTWNPTELCGNFSDAQPALSGGSWPTWCKDTTAIEWSGGCGSTFYDEHYEANPPTLEFSVPTDGQVFSEVPAAIDITVLIQEDSDLPLETSLSINGEAVPGYSDTNPAVWAGGQFPAGEYELSATTVDFWGNEASATVHFSVDEDDGSGDEVGDEGGDEGDATGGDDLGGEGGEGGVDSGGCACASTDDRDLGGGALGLLGLGLLGLGLRRRRG
nr:trypsin-like serine protease [Pseudenhygromyxa sp. WMMC2535]